MQGLVAFLLLVGAAGPQSAARLANADGAAPQKMLREAIEAFLNFDDAAAAAAFRKVLAAKPPSQIAAKAHLYLGLIAFNAILPDEAREEFQMAIRANPAIDVPPNTSPKASLAFAQARQEVTRDVAQAEASAPAPLPQAPPAPAPVLEPAPPPAVNQPAEPQPAPSHSHVLSLVLGGTAVALGVVAVVGGVQVLNYNAQVGAGNGSPGTMPGGPVAAAQGAANFWRFAWIGFAAGGAAAATAGVLTW